jgi:competence protein ComEA
MPWLYRLQSRVNLTGAEGTALVVLALALAGGLVARHLVASAAPPPPALYAAADAAFVAADAGHAPAAVPLLTPVSTASHAAVAADSLALAAADTSGAGPATAAFADAAPSADEAALVAEAVVEMSARQSRSGRKPPPEPTNINTAGLDELQRLPRVGPAIAARIIAYRQEVGRFRRPEDIMEVRGIGERTFERMAPWIRL